MWDFYITGAKKYLTCRAGRLTLVGAVILLLAVCCWLVLATMLVALCRAAATGDAARRGE
jgi:hypothetical protein